MGVGFRLSLDGVSRIYEDKDVYSYGKMYRLKCPAHFKL